MSSVQNLNPLTTTVYTVTGSLAPGCNNTKTVAVTVVQAPTITASNSGLTCVGQTATITASGGTTYNWSNGQTVSSFTVIPVSQGNITYNVAGSNGACNGYASTILMAYPNPTLSLVANPTIVCLGKTVTISASGATSYTWNNSWTSSNFLATPSVNTTYTLIGKTNGCSSTATITVPVQPPPVVSAFSSASVVCIGSAVSFSATGANTYTWNNGPATATFSLNAPGGTNTFTVTGSVGTCTGSGTVSVSGVPIPTITISNPSVLCQGVTATITASGANSYLWSNGSTSSAFTINPLMPGQYTLDVTGSNGLCSGAAQAIVAALSTPTISAAYSPTLPCAGDSVMITASGASTYSWSNGSSGSSLLVNPPVNTTYVIIGITNGCNSTTSITIPVQPLPTVNVISNASAVCLGTPVILSASGANSYTWSNGTINGSINVSPTVTTIYSVTGIANNSCINFATGTVVVNPLPTLFISSGSSLICSGENVTFNATGATLYIWNTGQVGANIIVSPKTTTTYTLNGTSPEGCQNSLVFTQSVSVCSVIDNEVNQLNQVRIIPNPTSGHLRILLRSEHSDLSVQMIDPMGRLIYSSLIGNENPEFDISGYPPGFYTICVYQNNALLFHKKVVKE